MLIFLHIPKTGGSTLNPVLDWNYNNKSFEITRYAQIAPFLALPDVEKLQYKVLRGQVYYGIHQAIPEACQYLSILRHPYKRLVSQYFYLNVRKASLGERLMDVPFEYFLEQEPFQAYMQLNLIAGGSNIDEALRRPLPADALERAIANIENDFPVLGTMDYYDESLLLMKGYFGWQRAFYSRQNINTSSPKFEDFPKATQALIEQACEPELALYDYAQKRIQAQIEAGGEDFARELAALKTANQRFSQFYRVSEPIRHSKLWFFLKGIARRIIR
jgi:hypothetical protein